LLVKAGIAAFGVARTGGAEIAPEGGLDMSARASESVVDLQLPECGIEIVAVQETNDPNAMPNALHVGRRPSHLARGVGNGLQFALAGGLGFGGGLGIGVGVLSQYRGRQARNQGGAKKRGSSTQNWEYHGPCRLVGSGDRVSAISAIRLGRHYDCRLPDRTAEMNRTAALCPAPAANVCKMSRALGRNPCSG
jgi:hypothetical protein